jgi:hypothetical protein
MMPEGEGGVCFKQGALVKENFQMCDITNRKILDQLKDKKPQATFSCNAETDECNFQCKLLFAIRKYRADQDVKSGLTERNPSTAPSIPVPRALPPNQTAISPITNARTSNAHVCRAECCVEKQGRLILETS